MTVARVERFARELEPLRIASVRAAALTKTEARRQALLSSLGENWEEARTRAAAIKDAVLDDLKSKLLQLEETCQRNGIQVHWAVDGESARRQILNIVENAAGPNATIVKAKTMATEEIHLNHALEAAGHEVVETDLGEFVVQIDHDTPSHIVMPIIHKNRYDVAKAFDREGIGPYTEDPTELALQARAHLREKFRKADVGISGVNFAVAETGRLVLVENEGNNRLSTTAPKTHIAVMGIEKVIPSESDLPLFLKLLVASATAQHMVSYVHFISGPRRPDEEDGPEQVHLILLDNGRTKACSGRYRSILRCIRCGACQNACPVYRATSGHAYGHVYAGPIGAVLANVLDGVQAQGELSKASSLCGLCEEVCPVKIPIPEMLLQLRDEYVRGGGDPGGPWELFAKAATDSGKWKGALTAIDYAGPLAGFFKGWSERREPPARIGRDFRKWWRGR